MRRAGPDRGRLEPVCRESERRTIGGSEWAGNRENLPRVYQVSSKPGSTAGADRAQWRLVRNESPPALRAGGASTPIRNQPRAKSGTRPAGPGRTPVGKLRAGCERAANQRAGAHVIRCQEIHLGLASAIHESASKTSGKTGVIAFRPIRTLRDGTRQGKIPPPGQRGEGGAVETVESRAGRQEAEPNDLSRPRPLRDPTGKNPPRPRQAGQGNGRTGRRYGSGGTCGETLSDGTEREKIPPPAPCRAEPRAGG